MVKIAKYCVCTVLFLSVLGVRAMGAEPKPGAKKRVAEIDIPPVKNGAAGSMPT